MAPATSIAAAAEDRPDDETDSHGRLDGGHGGLLLGEYQSRKGVVPRHDHRVECTKEELDGSKQCHNDRVTFHIAIKRDPPLLLNLYLLLGTG